MRFPDLLPKDGLNPDRVLTFLGQAMRLPSSALPGKWRELSARHVDILDDKCPLGMTWDGVGVCPVALPVRSLIFNGKTRSQLVAYYRLWSGAPMLCMDKQAAMGPSGLYVVLPRLFMEHVLSWSAVAHIVNPDYMGGVACFSVQAAVDARVTD